MGLSQVYGNGYAFPVSQFVQSMDEQARRRKAQRRLDIYQDRLLPHLRQVIVDAFSSEQVRQEIARFAPMACANSLLKRIVNDIARPIYAIPPRRRVDGDDGYGTLARELGINRVMDAAIRLTAAVNDVILFPRQVDGAGVVIDVMTGANCSVMTHPDAAQVPVALVYQRHAPGSFLEGVGRIGGPARLWSVVWDDEITMTLDESGAPVSAPTPHGLGRIPWVVMHRTVPTSTFWNSDEGEDLVAGSLQVALINALVLKLHKWQGEKTLAQVGDIPMSGQVLDAGGIVNFPTGSQVQQLDLVTQPSHYLATKAEIETTLASNYGISRQRLNQVDKGSDDVALRERTAELMQVARTAEADLFDLLRVVTGRISRTATITVDFGQLESRVDRKTQLDIWEKERAMGLSSAIDNLAWDNPEAETIDELEAILDENMVAEAAFIERRRALNMPADASMLAPGQDPVANGTMGPAVRDGRMTKDQAAEAGRKGPKQDARAVARRILGGK